MSEPDGTVRRVSYTASDTTGFQAKVERIGQKTQPRKAAIILTRPIVAAPYRGRSVYNPHSSYYFYG